MLETWAPDGTPMFRLGDRVIKCFGSASVGWSHTGATRTGTIVDSRFTAWPGVTPIVFITDTVFDPNGGGCEFSVSGNTLTWAFPREDVAAAYTRANTTFIYGIL